MENIVYKEVMKYKKNIYALINIIFSYKKRL